MKKMLAVLLTIAMLLPSLTTVIAASVEQVSISAVPAKEKIETASTGIKTTTGEKGNEKFTPTKDAVELFGFSSYYDGGEEANWFGFVSFMSNSPQTVSFINGYYDKAFVAGDYVPEIQSIFAVKNLGSTYALTSIDTTTFAETEIKAYGDFYFADMAFDISSGVMYGVKDMTLYTVELATGNYSEVGPTGVAAPIFTLACSDDGVLYSVDQSGMLYTVDKVTAAATLVGNTGLSVDYFQSMTWDHINGGLYWANCNSNEGALYFVDPATAMVTPLGNIHSANMEVTCLFTKGIYSGPPTSLTGVNIFPAEATIKLGKTVQLSARLDPWNATERGVSWVSENPAVATVDENGLVTAIGYGEATIKVTTVEGSFTDSSVITVPDTSEADAAFDAAINAPGGTLHFVNDEAYPWAIVTRGERIAVKSTNVECGGTQTFINLPSINMYRGNEISFDCLTNCETPYDKLVFNVNGEKVAEFTGENTDFTHYIYSAPTDGAYSFSWGYLKDDYSSIGEDSAYLDNVALDITPPGPVTGVTLNPSTVNIYEGQTAQLTAAVLPGSAIDTAVSFTSNSPTVAIVDQTGFITAIGEGTALITVTTNDGGFTATSTINVTSIADLMAEINAALNVTNGDLSFEMDMVNRWIIDAETFSGRSVVHSTTAGIGGSSTSITLTAETDGTKLMMFDWLVSSERNYDKAVFAIDGVEISNISGTRMSDFTTAAFNAGAPGMHTYTWTYSKDESGDGGLDMFWLDNITFAIPPEPDSIEMPETAKVHTGQTTKIFASVLPYYATDLTLNYTSSDESKLTVDENGFITGVAEGTAVVRATAVNGIYSECIVTVFDTVPAPNGMLYGFVASPSGITENLSGLVKIDPVAGTAEGVAEYYNDVFAAEYYNGVIYAYDNKLSEFVTFDAITGELLSSIAVPEIAYDMTYDYVTNTMYALFGGYDRGLATVNMTTGELTPIGIMPEGSMIITLASDNLGRLYGVSLHSGILYEIYKDTAECIEIGNTMVGTLSYVHSMTYSIETDTLYWTAYTDAPTYGGFLYSVDRNTGLATRIIEDPVGGVGGLITFNDGSSITPPTPTAVTGVSVTPTTLDLPWGGIHNLKATVAPINATNKRVVWTSGDENIVTVNNTGTLQAVGTGTTTVTVTTLDGGFTATCLVTVADCPYQPVAPGKAIIALTAGDVWSDGSGYQMLLDSTHSLFGTVIPVTGPLTQEGDVPQEIYDLFDYKIPENADGALTTENVVVNDSVYIIVDAGTYDFCITNPADGARMWIAYSADGSLGRCDDFVVEEGYVYEFVVEMRGENDFVSVSSSYIGTTGEPTYDPGDANLDGVVNTGDAAFLLRSFIGLEVLSDEGRAVSDLNNDGEVNTGDAAMILEMCIN
ncbi:MAG: Ig-like domain-containing protein [Clostridia bacterium]